MSGGKLNPIVHDTPGWIRDVNKRLDRNNGSGNGMPTVIAGTVDSGYSNGVPLIDYTTINGTFSVQPISMPFGWEPLPGQQVIVRQTGLGWVITDVLATKPQFLPQIPIPLNTANSYYSYSSASADTPQMYGEAQQGPLLLPASLLTLGTNIYATMTSTGIVHLMGLVVNNTLRAVGDIICTLPVGMRPARTQVFPIHVSGAYSLAYVTPDGNVRGLAAYPAGSGIRMDNITFRAKNFGTFVGLAPMVGTWTEYTTSFGPGDAGGAGSHTPGYTIDADGVVIFEGSAVNTGAAGNGTDVKQCTALTAGLTDIFLLAAQGGSGSYGRFGGASPLQYGTGNTLTVSAGAPSVNYWVSFASVIVIPSSTTTTWLPPALYNSWALYGSGNYNVFALARTPDGMIFSRGMMQSGGVATATPMSLVGNGWRPRYGVDNAAISNGAFGLVSVGYGWNASSTFNGRNMTYGPVSGSNVWFSMGNTHWPAYF